MLCFENIKQNKDKQKVFQSCNVSHCWSFVKRIWSVMLFIQPAELSNSLFPDSPLMIRYEKNQSIHKTKWWHTLSDVTQHFEFQTTDPNAHTQFRTGVQKFHMHFNGLSVSQNPHSSLPHIHIYMQCAFFDSSFKARRDAVWQQHTLHSCTEFLTSLVWKVSKVNRIWEYRTFQHAYSAVSVVLFCILSSIMVILLNY